MLNKLVTFNNSIMLFLKILEIHIWFLWLLHSCFSLYLFYPYISGSCTALISSGHLLNIGDFQHSSSWLSLFMLPTHSLVKLIHPPHRPASNYFLSVDNSQSIFLGLLPSWIPSRMMWPTSYWTSPLSSHLKSNMSEPEHSMVPQKAYSSSCMFMSIYNTHT